MATDIKDKIAMLLALAESPEEHEAKAALLKARELMAKYKLRPEEIRKAENVKVVRELLDVTCTAMTNPWVCTLSAVIAENYCCRSYRNRKRGGKTNTIGLIGLEDDFEICKKIFLYAYESVISYCKHQIKRDPSEASGTYREKCNAYGWGFTKGVREAFEEQQEQHQEWGLVLVVPKAVDDVYQSFGKPTAFGRVNNDAETAKYRAQGYADGVRFDPKHRLADVPQREALGVGV